MERKILLTVSILGLLAMVTQAQTYWKSSLGKGDVIWEYEFTTSSQNTSGYGLAEVSTSTSPTFLPSPVSGNVAITTYPRSVNATLNSPATFLLSGSCVTSSLTMTSTGGNGVVGNTGVSSFVINQIPGSTEIMSLHFNLTLGATYGNTNANWYFIIGRASHNLLGTTNTKSFEHTKKHDHDDRIYAVWRYIKSPTYPTRFAFSKMAQSPADFSDGKGKTWTSESSGNLESNTSYAIDIYCNNSSSPQQYMRNGTPVSLASGQYAIYVDGSLKDTFDKNAIASSSARPLDGFAIFSRDPAKSDTEQDNSSSLSISNLKVVYMGAVSTTPVTLTDFSGNATNTGIALNWQTVNEQNNAHFILNRSINGKDFSYLTRVEGNGSSNNVKHYSYIDKTPFAGTNYYQLEQIDKDGTKTVINKIVPVKYLVSDGVFSISKISSNQLRAFFNSENGENAELSITDISGKVIYKTNRILKQGNNQIDLFVPVKPGVYVATLKGTAEIKSVKFVL